MKVKHEPLERWHFHEIELLDGRTITEYELEAEEAARGKEFLVEMRGHVSYKSPIMVPKGVTYWREVEEK